MTKGTGQKHFQREDHAHEAHQTEAARHQDHDSMKKPRSVGKDHAEHDGHPAEQRPKSPQKGQ